MQLQAQVLRLEAQAHLPKKTFMKYFNDRVDAGQQLAARLTAKYKNDKDIIVLALPRGGVPIAYEVANTLHAPMTVFLVRKLGLPGNEEFAMGAIAENDTFILNQDVVSQYGITDQEIQFVLNKEKKEINRRLQTYRQGKALPSLNNKTVILIDDGIATGATCKAAIQALKNLNPKKVVLATPVASQESLQELSPLVDDLVCLASPEVFFGVGQWYRRFEQIEDEEVIRLLGKRNSNA